MDSDGQTLVVLFLVALPTSLCFWSVALVGAGVVTDVASMPQSFRLAASVFGAGRSRGPSARNVAGAAFGLLLVNFVPVGIVLHNPYGPLSLVAALVYLSVHAIWVARVAWTIKHTTQS